MIDNKHKPRKYNFFLSNKEKELFFTLKNLHKLNNKLGNDNETFFDFIEKMTCYYKNILLEYSQD